MNEPWFDPNVWSWLPGTLSGVLTGGYGAFAGWLAPRGAARKWVLGAHCALLALSAAMLVFAIAAFLAGQPYGIWYGFGLPGVVGAGLLTLRYPVIRQRYRDAELRRSMAADLG